VSTASGGSSGLREARSNYFAFFLDKLGAVVDDAAMSYYKDPDPDSWPSAAELAEDARLDSLPKPYGPMTEDQAAIHDEITREVNLAFDEMLPPSKPDHPF
jgi:hypothetical protein